MLNALPMGATLDAQELWLPRPYDRYDNPALYNLCAHRALPLPELRGSYRDELLRTLTDAESRMLDACSEAVMDALRVAADESFAYGSSLAPRTHEELIDHVRYSNRIPPGAERVLVTHVLAELVNARHVVPWEHGYATTMAALVCETGDEVAL